MSESSSSSSVAEPETVETEKPKEPETVRTTFNRRFHLPSNPWIPYVGDCKALEKYLKSKSGLPWLIPKYFNALLRGISQVILANNPLAGLIILTALFWANIFVGLGAIVASSAAILTAVLMRQDPDAIAAGLTTYNAVLIGTLTTSLWTPLYGEPLTLKLWLFIILGSILSVFVTSALSNILSSLKIPLPATTLPFNLVIVLLFVCLMPVQNEGPVALGFQQDLHNFNHIPAYPTKELDNKIDFVKNASILPTRRKREDVSVPTTDFNSTEEKLDWGKILRGVIVSSGQVYGIHDEISSVFIFIAVLIYSPIMCMMCGFGAILGTTCGLLFVPAPYDAIYNGVWGYNGLLSGAAVGGFFIVLTCHSFFTATANILFTAILQQALFTALNPIKLPIFTMPFALSTFLFLSVSTIGNHLPRVETVTFPEMHRYFYREASRAKREEKLKKKASIVAGEIAEEKALVLTDVKVVKEEDVKVDVETSADDAEVDKTQK